jgi:hypothetical protein
MACISLFATVPKNDDGGDDDSLCLQIGVSVPSHRNVWKKETTFRAM